MPRRMSLKRRLPLRISYDQEGPPTAQHFVGARHGAELSVSSHRGSLTRWAQASGTDSGPDDGRSVMPRLDPLCDSRNPANIPVEPVEQPTKFDVVIDMKTVKTLRLTVPRKLLAIAEEVI